MTTRRGILTVFFGLCVSARVVCADGPAIPYFVGRTVCLECHVKDHRAGACTLEAIPQHLKAYEALTRPEASEIALLGGIHTSPAEHRICLGCHATAGEEGPRWTQPTFKMADGVQCESCHGAGSLHVEAMKDKSLAGRHEGERHIRRGDRWRCKACHADRPSHRAVLEEGFRRSHADRLYKTPVNLAVSPDGAELYVVCEQSDSVMVVDIETENVVAEITVGRRPHGIAVSPDGERLYVTNRLSDTVSIIDATARRLLAAVEVGDEPHGVVVGRDGRRVFVANTADNSISVVDPAALTETRRLVGSEGPWGLALSADGGSIYATSVRPNLGRFRDPPESEITVIDVDRAVVRDRYSVPEANMLEGIDFAPASGVAIFTLMRTKNLVPLTRLAQGWSITNGLGVIQPDGRVDQVLLDLPHDAFPDPTDVAISPDGRHALVTSAGADRVAVVDVVELLALLDAATSRERAEVLPNLLGTCERFVVQHIAVGRNPRAVVFSPDGKSAFVVHSLDDTVSRIDLATLAVTATIALGGPETVSEIRHGERVFHSADNTFGWQFSCRSCHPDGHTNGLTFDIEADGVGMHPVDNRTLRGILDTAPFKWEGTNPSLHRQCGARLATFFTRLAPYGPDDLDALVRYMCTIEQGPNRHRAADGLTLAQMRGKAVFERARLNDGREIPMHRRCDTCHSGPYKSNRARAHLKNTMWFDAPVNLESFDLFNIGQYGDLGVFYFLETGGAPNVLDVPHLHNINEGAPYLHNGAARTLEEIWTRFNIVDDHGMTLDMTRQQFNDLIAYLEAL